MIKQKENNNIDKIIPPWYAKEFIRILNSKLMTLIAILVVVLVFINGLMPIKSLLLMSLKYLFIIPCLLNGVYMGICALLCMKTGYHKYL